jgi:hypothetical protein
VLACYWFFFIPLSFFVGEGQLGYEYQYFLVSIM